MILVRVVILPMAVAFCLRSAHIPIAKSGVEQFGDDVDSMVVSLSVCCLHAGRPPHPNPSGLNCDGGEHGLASKRVWHDER